MALEPTFNFIDDLNPNNPNNSPDQVKESANHHRGIKNAVTGSFPNLGQLAVNKTAAEINDLVQPATSDTLTNKTIDGALYIGTQSGFEGDVTGDLTGNVTGNTNGTHTGGVVGNSSTASAWSSSRTITISGDATGSGASTTGQNNIGISLANDSVRFSNEMNNTNSTGLWASGSFVPPGVFIISNLGTDNYNGTYQNVQYNGNGGWRNRIGGDYGTSNACVTSDGVNVKVVTSSGTIPYRKIFN